MQDVNHPALLPAYLAHHADHRKELCLGFCAQHDGGDLRVAAVQFHPVCAQAQHLAGGRIALPDGHHNVAVLGGDAAIDHQHVAAADAGLHHGRAVGSVKVGGSGVAYQVAIEVDHIVLKIFGRRRETQGGRGQIDGPVQRRRLRGGTAKELSLRVKTHQASA